MEPKVKEESPQEKSKRLQENLLKKKKSNEVKSGRSSQDKSPSSGEYLNDLKLRKESIATKDFTNVNVKAEPINIRDHLTTEGPPLGGQGGFFGSFQRMTGSWEDPTVNTIWIPSVAVASLIGASLIARLFFRKQSSATDEHRHHRHHKRGKGKPRQQESPSSNVDMGELKRQVDEIRNRVDRVQSHKDFNGFVKTVNGLLTTAQWTADEEHLHFLSDQLAYLLNDIDQVRQEMDDSYHSIVTQWMCSLLDAKRCLTTASMLDHFEEKLFLLAEKVESCKLDLALKRLEREAPLSITTTSSGSMDMQVVSDTAGHQSPAVLALMMTQELRHHHQGESMRRRRDDAVRDIDRKLAQCRNRQQKMKEESERVQKWTSRRKLLLDMINRGVFSFGFVTAVVVFWSLQSSCQWKGDWKEYTQCTLLGTLQTTCRYVSPSAGTSKQPAALSPLWTLLLNPIGFSETLYRNPWETVYSTAVSAPMDVLTGATSVLSLFVGSWKQTVLPLEYVYCGGYFLARCTPAYLVQILFSVVYLSSIGSFLSWLLLVVFFSDVAMQLIHEPLWPLVVLSVVHLVFYAISQVTVKIDINRSLLSFYSLYIVTITLCPLLWTYREHIVAWSREYL